MERGRELLRPIDKKEYDDFMVIILNNSYFLLQEHITLGLLSDTRRPLRILGKKIILKGGLISEYFTLVDSPNMPNHYPHFFLFWLKS